MFAVGGLQWDRGNWPKCGKHGVSRGEIEALFASNFAVHPAPSHSRDEARYLAIGKTLESRWLFVAFTLREAAGKTFVRPLSARYMHQKEVRHYEQQKGP